jgi:hypothetical protein
VQIDPIGNLHQLFASDFMAYGYCYLWKPEIVGLHVVSDTLITLASYSILVTLVYFEENHQRGDTAGDCRTRRHLRLDSKI